MIYHQMVWYYIFSKIEEVFRIWLTALSYDGQLGNLGVKEAIASSANITD